MPHYLNTLDQPVLAALGIDGWAYGYTDRVRFCELDALNHVNNVEFLRWFETIRVAYVVDYGFTSYNGADDPMLVVRRVTADYHAPVFQHEDYTVTARTRSLKSSSFIMDYAIFSDGSLRATGEAVVISLENDGRTRKTHKPGAVEAVLTRDNAENLI